MEIVSRFDDNAVGRYEDRLLVRYSFVMNIGSDKHEVKGVKTLKLFRAWFRLACNWHYKYTPASRRREMLYGFVEFINGERWIWQNRKHVYHGGWHIVKQGKWPLFKESGRNRSREEQ